jgi:hypothetical protein
MGCVRHDAPSTSYTMNDGPKSVNTFANTPRVSTRMNAIGGLCAWQTSLMRLDSCSDVSVSTTTCGGDKGGRGAGCRHACIHATDATEAECAMSHG